MLANRPHFLCVLLAAVASSASPACQDRRPPAADRTFTSAAVDAFVYNLSARIQSGDSELACLFRNTLPNSLDTTLDRTDVDHTFVITGDIRAMWLRDSTNQVLPYVEHGAADPELAAVLGGVLRTQTQQVLASPYANAHFRVDSGVVTPNGGDDTSSPTPLCRSSHGNCSYAGRRQSGMIPGIYERKYELDSLLAFLKLGRMLHAAAEPDAALALGGLGLFGDDWLTAVGAVLDVLEAQQHSSADDAAGPCGPAYTFTRSDIAGQGPGDTLLNGVGAPAMYTGMVRSAFRPSDDACRFAFHVPANAMAVVELRKTADLIIGLAGWRGRNASEAAAGGRGGAVAASLADQLSVAKRCEKLAAQIVAGIERYGVVDRPDLGGGVYAYEVDGFGNANLMDDANVPSLLSLPWLGFVPANDPTYVRTRAYVLSNKTNPWFYAGKAGEGVGSPHTGPYTVWPMAITMRALTSDSDDEIAKALATLKASAAAPGSWLMHESFAMGDASTFTRPWFAWANSLFGELIVKLSRERPHLIGINASLV